jgi:anti-sigma B factor antagonist
MPHGRSDFSLAFSRALGKVVVHVHGVLDARTAPVLRQRLADLVQAQGNLSVVLDLRDMPFIDHRGVAVLAETHAWLEAKGGEFVLSGPSPEARRQLEPTGLRKCLRIVPAWAHPAHGRSTGTRGPHVP